MNSQTKISRSDLITKCDDFLVDKIDTKELVNFAEKLIADDNFDINDERVDKIIHEWDMREMSYPLTKTNVGLWKEYLITGNDRLIEFNNWNFHIDAQKKMCSKYQSDWNPINKKFKIGVSDNLNQDPINGFRHPQENGTTGWYIWTGEYSESEEFYKPLCAEHLLQIRPEIIKYLGLDVGFRFLTDSKGSEDVWYDENLKKI